MPLQFFCIMINEMVNCMPIISEFFGIKIYMYWSEHLPPHFHAEYGDHSVIVDINNCAVIKGVFPFKQLKFVIAWCELHREELLANWKSAMQNKPIQKIAPLQ